MCAGNPERPTPWHMPTRRPRPTHISRARAENHGGEARADAGGDAEHDRVARGQRQQASRSPREEGREQPGHEGYLQPRLLHAGAALQPNPLLLQTHLATTVDRISLLCRLPACRLTRSTRRPSSSSSTAATRTRAPSTSRGGASSPPSSRCSLVRSRPAAARALGLLACSRRVHVLARTHLL